MEQQGEAVLDSIPVGSVDAVGVLLEGGQGGWAVHVPQLDCVVPATAQKYIPPHQVPAEAVHLQHNIQDQMLQRDIANSRATKLI